MEQTVIDKGGTKRPGENEMVSLPSIAHHWEDQRLKPSNSLARHRSFSRSPTLETKPPLRFTLDMIRVPSHGNKKLDDTLLEVSEDLPKNVGCEFPQKNCHSSYNFSLGGYERTSKETEFEDCI
jgi:hypothetical protein